MNDLCQNCGLELGTHDMESLRCLDVNNTWRPPAPVTEPAGETDAFHEIDANTLRDVAQALYGDKWPTAWQTPLATNILKLRQERDSLRAQLDEANATLREARIKAADDAHAVNIWKTAARASAKELVAARAKIAELEAKLARE